jgi:hypothetical protein
LKPTNDRTLEGNETVEVSLIGSAAYSVGNPGAATITIVDDEEPPPIVSIEATDSTASETAPDSGEFTISRTGSTQKALAVKCKVSGSAKNGSDYQRLSRFTIPAGQASLVVTVLPRDDALVESKETVTLTISPNRAYQVRGAGAATVFISDND